MYFPEWMPLTPVAQRWVSLGVQLTDPKPTPRSGHTLSAYGKCLLLLGGSKRSGIEVCSLEESVFALDTSLLVFPSDVESPRGHSERNISFRSVISEPISFTTESTSPLHSRGSPLIDYDEAIAHTFDIHFENLPSEGFYNTDLLEFLQNQCGNLSKKLKIKFQDYQSPRQPHWTAGDHQDISCQRPIDSGANGDVYQVQPTSY